MTAATTSSRSLLTVLHAAERTGPPLFALQFLRWLKKEHPTWKSNVLFLDSGGDLEEEFAELGQTLVASPDLPYAPGGRWTHRSYVRSQLRHLGQRIERLGPVDVTHVHCAGSMRVFPALPDAPVLCHLHELDVGLDLHLGPLARKHLTHADRYVAVSDGVRDRFLAQFEVSPEKVDKQWGFVEETRLPQEANRQSLGIAPESFVVVASGLRHWRKAPELFVRTAIAARRVAPEVPWQFLWIGGSDVGGLEDLVRKAGLEELVHFLPHQPEPLAWIAASDIFFLPAREDAFPLVCVESAALGIPIVTFDNGGAAELVTRANCGTVVPFPDVLAAAQALAAIAADPAASAELGTRAREFATQNLLLESAGPALFTSIDATSKVAR